MTIALTSTLCKGVAQPQLGLMTPQPSPRRSKRQRVSPSPSKASGSASKTSSNRLQQNERKQMAYVAVPSVVRTSPTLQKGPAIKYKPPSDEILEDGSLLLHGETIPDEEDLLPIRLLKNFVVYNRQKKTFEYFEPLPQNVLSGYVFPYYEDEEEGEVDDESGDDDEGQPICLNKIDKYWIDTTYRDYQIWAHTKHAWYILGTPAEQYLPYFRRFFIIHILIHAIASALDADRHMTYQEFIHSLDVGEESSDAIASVIGVLGRPLSEEDLANEDMKSFLLGKMLDWKGFRKYRNAPLIVGIFGDTHLPFSERDEYMCSDDADNSDGSNYESPQKRQKTSKTSASPNLEKEVLKHRNTTETTPIVGRIARGLFPILQHSVQCSSETADGPEKVQDDPPITAPEYNEILWGKCIPGQANHYQSIFLDGVEYKIGDVVAVEMGENEDSEDAKNAALLSARTSDPLGNGAWFAQIQYFVQKTDEDGRGMAFHGRWFSHGAKTILAETANPSSLYLTNICDDNDVEIIIRKCFVTFAKPHDKPADQLNEVLPPDHYFCEFIYDKQTLSFTDIDPEAGLIGQFCHSHERCYNCALKRKDDCESIYAITTEPEGIAIQGLIYHLYDFVYTRVGDSSLYKIAQITNLRLHERGHQKKITIQFYSRCDRLVEDDYHYPGLERQLFRSKKSRTILVDDLIGKCTVFHFSGDRDELLINLDDPDVFFAGHTATSEDTRSFEDMYVLPFSDWHQCDHCFDERDAKEDHRKAYMRQKGPLRALELFSGAGGLSHGMEMSGFVKTKWAVEFSPSASMTYKHNHPEAIVYNQCSNLLLRHAMTRGKSNLTSLDGKGTRLPAMPQKGEVDLIMGGPPCQSFSGMNRFKKADDIRNTLVCNMISYVEYYQPDYFLLENVVGLLNTRLKGKEDGRRIVGGIEHGVVKFIMRALIALGYQVEIGVLQAGQFGVPQDRLRVIVWGARRGVTLPKYPHPTHVFQGRVHKHSLGYLATIKQISRNPEKDSDEHEHWRCAPLRAVKVDEAIDDLPGFHWKDPRISVRRMKHEPDQDDDDLLFPTFIAHRSRTGTGPDGPVGFTQPEQYRCQPRTIYQAWLRREMGKDDKVAYQYTQRFRDRTVEWTVNVPMRPDADYFDLPRPYQTLEKPSKNGKATGRKKNRIYIRLDGKRFFGTAMTSVNPNSSFCVCLHPSQRRIITIRECARAQGFPDHYLFLSINENEKTKFDDQQRQIGNAVPIPLARALGRALGETLLKDFQVEPEADDYDRMSEEL